VTLKPPIGRCFGDKIHPLRPEAFALMDFERRIRIITYMSDG